jgi:predicted short-subunit dehydrogenase-like oxidoreductase (DUF2520 family)
MRQDSSQTGRLAPQSPLTIGFIGAGKAGTSFGKYLAVRTAEQDDARVRLAGYFSRTPDSARSAAALTGRAAFETDLRLAEASDVIFFSVPDGEIEAAFSGLVSRSKESDADLSGKLFAHLSGSLSSKIFLAPGASARRVFSLHPACALPGRETSWERLRETCFTFEGDDDARAQIAPLLETIGNRVARIAPEQKTLYHAACVFLSNFSVALAAEGAALLAACGMGPETSSAFLKTLFLGNAKNVAEKGPTAALTGPLERGDAGTIREHRAALSALGDSAASSAYDDLTKLLLRVAKEKHPDRDYTNIIKALSE